MSCAIITDAIITGSPLPGFGVELLIAAAAFVVLRGLGRALAYAAAGVRSRTA